MMTSEALEAFLWKHGTKKIIANLAENIYLGGSDFKGMLPSRSMYEQYDIESIVYKGHKVYSVVSKGVTQADIVFYLHGGGFAWGLSKIQWDFIGYLADHLSYRVIVPDYPLVPHVTFRDIYDYVLEVYRYTAHIKSRLFVVGDSAGASLVLGLSQLIEQQDLRKPEHMILISPWMDIELNNPMIDAIDAIDPTLDRNGLKTIERLYADGEKKNPLVSPIYGDYSYVSPMSLFIGTRDILYPDCKLFELDCKAKGIDLSFYEYEDMIHIFPLFDTPEGNEAKLMILNIMK